MSKRLSSLPNIIPMAFSFEDTTEQFHVATELAWTPEAHALLSNLDRSLWAQKKSLPRQDLRMHLQIRDARVIRTDTFLGLKDGTLAFTRADPPTALKAANDAAAVWALESLAPLSEREGLLPGPASAAGTLRRMALAGQAVRGRQEPSAVLTWETNRQTGTARVPFGSRQYAALADHVADLIEGQEVYPERGPLRRVIRGDVISNEVSLMTDVITLPAPNGPDVRFSLGVTLSAETYPGRTRPVIKVHHKKFVWAREPSSGNQHLSGYVLPAGETRALRFELGKHLELGVDYQLLAAAYQLPSLVTAASLGLHGTSGAYGAHRVVITHKNGRAETDAALYGVTDLNRRESFARLTALLADAGFTPWAGLEVVETTSRSETDLDAAWASAFDGGVRVVRKGKGVRPAPALSLFGAPPEVVAAPEPEPTAAVALLDARKAQKDQAMRQKKLTDWAVRMQANIDAHYGGTHQIVIGYGPNLQAEAQRAEKILRTVLKDGATILQRRLPDAVHGSRRELPGQDLSRPSERAEERLKAWKPFIEELQEYQQQHPDQPLRSALIIADRWYPGGHDDVINKRVARVALNRTLGLTVQYLLPSKTRRDGSIPEDAVAEFRMRTINAWRDLAWKGLGKMDGIEEKARELLGTAGRPVLGVGVIRVNRKAFQKNDASFVPYVIELDPVTGACSGSVMLGRGEQEAQVTPFLPLPQLLRALSEYGPSPLARRKNTNETNKVRRELTQKFIAQMLVQRTQQHPDLIVLADAGTLGGLWPWLSDANVNPNDITLAGQDHFEGNCPDATFIRIRSDVSPKVVRDAPKTRIRVDGEVVPAAVWSDAHLYRVADAEPGLHTYLSFGSKIIQRPRAISSDRFVTEENGNVRPPYLDAYQTPNPVDITVIRAGGLEPDDLARFVEALRREYAHFGSWINSPGPLHFASVLKEYIPDYDLSDEEDEAREIPDNGMDPLF